MKFSLLIKDYLTFNQKEQRGIVILLSLYFLLVFATLYFPGIIPEKTIDFTSFEKEISAFEIALAKLDSEELLAKQSKYKNYKKGGFYHAYDTSRRFQKEQKENLIIELNSADTFELQRLRGIGSSFARRIIKYRERLGGFHDKYQVAEVWGMDTARYNKISANLAVNRDSIHKINLNTVTFKELLFHPYFPFEITKAIMLYRKDHKKFTSLDELLSVPGIHDSTYKKIVNYLFLDIQ